MDFVPILGVMIPILALCVPIVVIFTRHQQQMAMIARGQLPQQNNEVNALRQEVYELRALVQRQSLDIQKMLSMQGGHESTPPIRFNS